MNESRIRADYTKYLREVAEQYNYGQDGKFPPTVNADRLLEFDEYVVWWNEREKRIGEIREYLNTRKVW
jgi:hypothetical protein